ncbi:hypothetical protein ACFLQU_05030, partial [Verrucomicrobiota bacterium]
RDGVRRKSDSVRRKRTLRELEMTSDPGNNSIIRITREEAMGSHADDLLNRQKNMRGEGGTSGRNVRHWYYQSCVALSVAGVLGGLVAWALLEPFVDDYIFLQGDIELRSTTAICG